MPLSRRNAIQNIFAGLAGSGLGLFSLEKEEVTEIPKGLRVLFQGDSITDAGRNRGDYYANRGGGMGQGYVRHIVTHMLGNHPGDEPQIYNRGISGHKVFQLSNRWEEDCMMLKPDVLSVLIGVNDFWHTLSGNYKGTAKVYEDDFMALMERTKKGMPDVKLIIGEPFVLHKGTAIVPEKWKGHFEGYQAASKRVADQFDAVFIPYQKVFDEALKEAPTSYWCPDGVHPSMAGNYLMSQAWLKAFMKVMG
ncbi:MAG: SGNH/GDSL hydrolase family protein [Bacteroidota bacterium]